MSADLFYHPSYEELRKINDVTVSSPFIYTPQDTRNFLWRQCVEHKRTFKECYREVNNSLATLIEMGLNKNFFTRDRWLDVEFISLDLKLSLADFIQKFEIDTAQRKTWKLRKHEKQQWRENCRRVASK